MKKIKINSLEGSSLTREQLKQVVGGSGSLPCSGKGAGAPCSWSGKSGTCQYWPFAGLICVCR